MNVPHTKAELFWKLLLESNTSIETVGKSDDIHAPALALAHPAFAVLVHRTVLTSSRINLLIL